MSVSYGSIPAYRQIFANGGFPYLTVVLRGCSIESDYSMTTTRG